MLKIILSDIGKTLLSVTAIVIAICAWARVEYKLKSLDLNVADKNHLLWVMLDQLRENDNLLHTNQKNLRDDQQELLKYQNISYMMYVRDVSNIVDSISSIRETLNTKQDKQ